MAWDCVKIFFPWAGQAVHMHFALGLEHAQPNNWAVDVHFAQGLEGTLYIELSLGLGLGKTGLWPMVQDSSTSTAWLSRQHAPAVGHGSGFEDTRFKASAHQCQDLTAPVAEAL